MVHQRNRRIHSGQGLSGSFDVPFAVDSPLAGKDLAFHNGGTFPMANASQVHCSS